jgi:predicted GNAT superfamily acetyltransferase
MHITVHAVSTENGDGWVVNIPKCITKSGISEKGKGWDDALEEGLSYLINKGYSTVHVFTTNRDTKVNSSIRNYFTTFSWNYITANQVDYNLRQLAYGAIWN